MDYRWYDPSMDVVPVRKEKKVEREVHVPDKTDPPNNPPVDYDPQDVEGAENEMPATVPDMPV